MIETRRYGFDGSTLPIVYEPAGPWRAHAHRDLLEHLSQEKDEFLSELHQCGALLFRAWSIEGARDFQEVVRIFAPNLSSYAGGDSPRSVVTGKVYTSTSYPASLPIALHNEMSYTRDHPSLIAFYCEIAPQVDGETPLADCRRVLASLPRDLVERFERKRIRYVQNLHAGAGLGKSWQKTFETGDPADVERILKSRGAEFEWRKDGALRVSEVIQPIITHPYSHEPVFFGQAHLWHVSSLDPKTREALSKTVKEDDMYHSCTYGDGSPIDEGDLGEIRRAFDASAIWFSWQKRDLLLVDNVLAAHGRRPFKGDRRILVAMG
jgi:alpha-ketoglutarate-dependent taurine dioxygenase